MFSKKALIYTIITAVSTIGGYILYIFTGMVGLFIAPPIITILGILFFYFIKEKKIEDYLEKKNSWNFQKIVEKIQEFFEKPENMDEKNIFILAYDGNINKLKSNKGVAFFGYKLEKIDRQKANKFKEDSNDGFVIKSNKEDKEEDEDEDED